MGASIRNKNAMRGKTPMGGKVNMRCQQSHLDKWDARAKKEGLTLRDWIKITLNKEVDS